MIRNPIDVASRVSPNLSALIESQVNDPDTEQPVTLATVRTFIASLLPVSFSEQNNSTILILTYHYLMK